MAVIYGLVLAGGRSRRFGLEKAAALVEGRPMLAHVADRLRPAVARLAINAPPASWAAAWAAEHALPCLPDRPGDPDGPLSGLRAGLAWAAAEGADLLATAPCDTPRLPFDLVQRLTAALTPQARAVAARTTDGLQPLCAVWRCDGLKVVEAMLADGHPPMHAVLAAMSAAEVMFQDAATFDNLNRPEQLERATSPSPWNGRGLG